MITKTVEISESEIRQEPVGTIISKKTNLIIKIKFFGLLVYKEINVIK